MTKKMKSVLFPKRHSADFLDGQQADLYTLTNANGMTVNITNYGGIITKLTAPDKKGQWARRGEGSGL